MLEFRDHGSQSGRGRAEGRKVQGREETREGEGGEEASGQGGRQEEEEQEECRDLQDLHLQGFEAGKKRRLLLLLMTFANWCKYVETGGDRRQDRNAFDVVPCETSFSGLLCAEDMMVMCTAIFSL